MKTAILISGTPLAVETILAWLDVRGMKVEKQENGHYKAVKVTYPTKREARICLTACWVNLMLKEKEPLDPDDYEHKVKFKFRKLATAQIWKA